MKQVMGILVSFGIAGSALASNLNLTVQQNCGNGVATDCPTLVNASAGAVIQYQVVGQLTDALNDGMALVGFDLALVAAGTNYPLPPANTPTTSPMNHFANPLGINNPGGFGGTLQGNVLRQVGGGQNTINNTVGNAPYPIGPVIDDVAQTSRVLVTGSFTVPNPCPMGLKLELTSPFANVIKDNESGVPFHKTEAAGMGTIISLSVECGDVLLPSIASTTPVSGAVDPRQPSNTDGSSPSGFASLELAFGGNAADVEMADFAIDSPTGGAVPTLVAFTPNGVNGTLTFSGPIPAGHWTRISYEGDGGPICLGFLPADMDGNRTASALDIIRTVDCLNGVQVCPFGDINRSGQFNAQDILRVVDLLNGAGTFELWNGRTLIANPCAN